MNLNKKQNALANKLTLYITNYYTIASKPFNYFIKIESAFIQTQHFYSFISAYLTIGQSSLQKMKNQNLQFLSNKKVILAATATCIAICLSYLTMQRSLTHKLKARASMQYPHIENGKIIVAIEIDNLLVNYVKEERLGFRKLVRKNKGFIDKIIKSFAVKTHSFIEKAPPKNIRKFIKDLKILNNIRVIIYTGIEQCFTTQILQFLGIEIYFPPADRIYMQMDHKSASQVNHDTGRVMVISAKNEDRKDHVMSSNHNLILAVDDHADIVTLLEELGQFVRRLDSRGRQDQLHETMYELAVDLGLPLASDSYLSY